VTECMAHVSSPEFIDWIAFWTIEAEANATGEDAEPPSPEVLGTKIAAWAQKHNAGVAAREAREAAVKG
jgi:hypothetical protein